MIDVETLKAPPPSKETAMDNISFRSMVVKEVSDKLFIREIKQKHIEDLPAGDVLIKVQYSSLNLRIPSPIRLS